MNIITRELLIDKDLGNNIISLKEVYFYKKNIKEKKEEDVKKDTNKDKDKKSIFLETNHDIKNLVEKKIKID